MKTRGYYAFPDPRHKSINHCSRASDEMPLMVNCAGVLETKFPFTTYNPTGRLDYYLLYVVSGSLTVRIAKEEHVMGEGCAILFPPNYPYHYVYQSPKSPLQYFWVHFTGSHAQAYLNKFGLSPLPTIWELGYGNHLPMHFSRLLEQFANEQPLSECVISCTMEQLLLSLAKTVHTRGRNSNPIARSLKYINEGYTAEIRIPDLATMENLSVSRYNVLFRQITGTSPIHYITRLRMDSACELLMSTDLSVKQIGILVGYTDANFFSKLFKRYMGQSPQQYRLQPTVNG